MSDTASETNTVNPISDADLVQVCCRALDEKKAEDIKILYLGQKSSVADYFVIATGTSSPHLRALRVALEKELDSYKAGILGMDMDSDSGWVVVDAENIIFHCFTKPMRDLYSLESLWKDAEEIPVQVVVEARAKLAAEAKAAKTVKKKSAGKKPVGKAAAKKSAKPARKSAAGKTSAKAVRKTAKTAKTATKKTPAKKKAAAKTVSTTKAKAKAKTAKPVKAAAKKKAAGAVKAAKTGTATRKSSKKAPAKKAAKKAK